MTVAKSIRPLVQLCTFMSRSTPDSDCSRHVFARNFLAKSLGFLDVDGDRTVGKPSMPSYTNTTLFMHPTLGRYAAVGGMSAQQL